MAFKINWAPAALNDYMQVLTYLTSTWEKGSANSFVDKVDKKASSVSSNPGIGRMCGQEPNVRRFVITSHNLLYYKANQETIEIVAVFDTRQNPSKNRFG